MPCTSIGLKLIWTSPKIFWPKIASNSINVSKNTNKDKKDICKMGVPEKKRRKSKGRKNILKKMDQKRTNLFLKNIQLYVWRRKIPIEIEATFTDSHNFGIAQ